MAWFFFSNPQAEKELAEYHKLARKLKLIPHSAANACGHDFEIKSLCEYGTAAMTEYKAQIQVQSFSTWCKECKAMVSVLGCDLYVCV